MTKSRLSLTGAIEWPQIRGRREIEVGPTTGSNKLRNLSGMCFLIGMHNKKLN